MFAVGPDNPDGLPTEDLDRPGRGAVEPRRSRGMLVMRLPNESRKTTSPVSPSTSSTGSRAEGRTSSVRRRPEFCRVAPRSRWAAAGARMSRPWKVGETTGLRSLRGSGSPRHPTGLGPGGHRRSGRCRGGRTSARPPSPRSGDGPSRPRGRRPPGGPSRADRYGTIAARTKAPSAMHWGEIAWLTSTMTVPGARPRAPPP